MSKFVIKRTDQGGGYVTPPGWQNSYTSMLQHAWQFDSRASAEANCCPGNEVVLPLEDADDRRRGGPNDQ